MVFLERAGAPVKYRHWQGNMEADYIYTTGIAGDRFFKALRDEGKLLASRCPSCKALDLPPRLFCEFCFSESEGFEEVKPEGTLEAWTVLRVGLDGSPLAQPEVRALVRFPGVRGGLLHRVAAAPESVRAGMRVQVVLKPRGERQGDLHDILHFQPMEGKAKAPTAPKPRGASRKG